MSSKHMFDNLSIVFALYFEQIYKTCTRYADHKKQQPTNNNPILWPCGPGKFSNITLRPRQNGHHFTDDIFKCILLNENVWISLKISLKFVPKVRINNIPAIVHKMAWRDPVDKPLSESMMVRLLTHICVTRPQWDMSNYHDTRYPYLNATGELCSLGDRRSTWIHVTFSCSSMTVNKCMAPTLSLYSHIADVCY